uniref:Ubiquinone biosynthesis protein n=1 Tax=Strombidium rassoulzadegani TaxID=1082188 RepID=A0A7S3FXP4_9SPIT|mmetsp:Transcript_8593/g.14507  ORF Transcript_8593/g.14507 Transcript_8593/m.14507 type:complete len:198 (+) Transcript_8593:224-817(+)
MDQWLEQTKEDLQSYSIEKPDLENVGATRDVPFAELDTQEMLFAGLKTRLQLMSPYIDKWPQAMVLGLKPQNVRTTLGKLHAIQDEIWFQAGDRSNDISWYAKRMMLFKIYCLTETYMLQDKSADFADTWLFLERRIKEADDLHHTISQSKTLGETVSKGVFSIMSILSPSNLNMDDKKMKDMQEELHKQQNKTKDE